MLPIWRLQINPPIHAPMRLSLVSAAQGLTDERTQKVTSDDRSAAMIGARKHSTDDYSKMADDKFRGSRPGLTRHRREVFADLLDAECCRVKVAAQPPGILFVIGVIGIR